MAKNTMPLSEKGPLKKPPVLKGPAQKVSAEIQSWAEVISATHWTIGDTTKVNGADFYRNEAELGHVHLDGELHIPLTAKIQRALIGRKIAEPFPWGRHWVQFRIEDKQSAATGLWLFQLAYDRLGGADEAEILERIKAFDF